MFIHIYICMLNSKGNEKMEGNAKKQQHIGRMYASGKKFKKNVL